ncbi:PP2C family protein-serine/threonine phosphatase [Spiroplasma turonicum]|uniref:Phosphorylated protein phosphatase n=1 Tax=Spiroplasma turonicum TaxID=216946 RepID=A0A0K1P533_9MOLU|nr:protein phosphatase 2C domain-containing protein [Spiroplasma turonicum]AKU79426.1 phosphorylated protein phosphatase [Spiroplasma turonicum]ALX70447.1 phosphorylated protein phosphatase [Spiroplasma turonicum]
MKFKHAMLTDIGNYRKLNQDYAGFSENGNGYAFGIVCDGMGGHAHGEVASKIAVEKFITLFDSQDFNGMSNKDINRWLRNSVNEILNEMVEYSNDHFETKDMGTTLTAILFTKVGAFVVNIGDSRTYKLVGEDLHQITQDQNLWNSTPEAERNDMKISGLYSEVNEVTFWKVLTSALGPQKTLRIDTYYIEEMKGIYILTTDGIHDYMDNDLTISTLGNKKIKLKDKAFYIIEDAKENVSTDNLTILIIEVE